MNSWYHKEPREYYKRCVEMFGKPTAESNKKGGFAFWKTKGLFHEHILRDEYVKHCVPRPHYDYFYSSIKYHVPKTKVMDVLKISGSLNYDGLKKLLTARCGGIGANYATIYLAMMVADGKMKIEEIKKKNLYPKMISNELMTREEMVKKMKEMKKKNNKKYKKVLKHPFASYAYNKCYTQKMRGGKKNKTRKAKIGKGLKNTRNEDCSKRDSTSCCPHMQPDEKGRYRATNEKSILHYKGKKYELHTCCLMCSDAMSALSKQDPERFASTYIVSFMENGNMIAKNAHTKKPVQILKLLQ